MGLAVGTQTQIEEAVREPAVGDNSIEDARWMLGVVLVLGLIVLSAGVASAMVGS